MSEEDRSRKTSERKPQATETIQRKYLPIYRQMGDAFYARDLGDHRITVPLVFDNTPPIEKDEVRVVISGEKRNRADFKTAIQRALFFMDSTSNRPSFTEEQVQSSVRSYILAVANGARDRILNTPNYQRVRDTSHHY